MSVEYKQIITDDLTGEQRENVPYITVNFYWRLVSGSVNGGGDAPEAVGTFFTYSSAVIWTSDRLLKGVHFKRGDNVWALERVGFAETTYADKPSLMLAYDHQWLSMEEFRRDSA